MSTQNVQEHRVTPLSDGCPRWASELISRICDLEIQLGNINPPGDWQANRFKDIYDRLEQVEDSDLSYAEGVVESLFARVARGLKAEGFDTAKIAAFINARVPSGGRLPYCNAEEVRQAL